MGQRHKYADAIIAFFMGDKYRVKPPAKKYRVALFNNIYTSTADTPEDVEFYEKDIGFVRWLIDWVEYEE